MMPPAFGRLRHRARLLVPVLDQALISGGNFASGVIVARSLETEQFGAWVLATILLWVAGPVQAGLVMQPLIVNGAGLDDRQFGRYLRGVLPLQLAFTALSAVVIGAVALLWEPVRPVALPLVVAMTALQGQDLCRRVLSARGRLGWATASNVVNYDCQALGLALLALAGSLTLVAAMWVVAATALLALAIGLWAVRPFLASHGEAAGEAIRRTLQIGRWTASAELLHALSETAFPMLLGVLAGLEAAAGYGVVIQIVGALNVLNRPIQTYFLPRAAAAWADGGAPALGRVLRDVWLVAGPPHVAFIALVVCFPGTVLSALYGERYAAYAGALELFALVCALTLLYQVLALKAHALRRQRFLLFGQVGSAALVFGLSPLLLPTLGLTGAGLIWLAVGAVRVASAWLPTSAAVTGTATRGGPAAQLRRRILYGRAG